jgi:hypothetical protein
VLAHYGLAPEPAATRFEAARQARLARGAIPAEVERALQAMAHRAGAELARLEAIHAGAGPFSAARARLAARVRREAEAYVAGAAQAAPGGADVASVFANARATSKQVPWARDPVPAAMILACPACGAPQERPLDFTCRYCRAPLGGPR